FDAPVIQVARVAGETQRGCGVLGEIAESDALHAAADEPSPGMLRWIAHQRIYSTRGGGTRMSALLIGHPPNHFPAIVRNQHAAIAQLQECHGAAPDFL